MAQASLSPPRTRLQRLPRLLSDASIVTMFGFAAVACFQRFAQTGSLLSFTLLAFNAVVVVLFLLRREAHSLSRSPWAWLAAAAGTMLPLLVRPCDAPVTLALVGFSLQVVATLLIIGALLSLGRSIGIVAADRGIRTGGMYRLVRHPLYATEMLFIAGFTLGNPSWYNACLLLLEVVLQVNRALIEERLLSQNPDYADYMKTVRFRLIPGLV